MLRIKHLIVLAAMAMFALTACNEKGDGHLSTDLVTSPKSATDTSEKQAVIKFENEWHDFGTLLQGEVVTYSFHFTNTGDMPLIISDVRSSCGCTVGDYPRQPIEPGKSGAIKVTYDSKGHHGFQSRTLTVLTNTLPAKTTLRIKAIVQTPDQY